MSSEKKQERERALKEEGFLTMPGEIKLEIAGLLTPQENIYNFQVAKGFSEFSGDNKLWRGYLRPNHAPTTDAKAVFRDYPAERSFLYWPPMKDLTTIRTFHGRLMQSDPQDPHALLRLAEIILDSESLEADRPYAVEILRGILALNATDALIRAKIYMHLGSLILSEDLVLQMNDLPETMDRAAFLQEPEEEQAAVCFRYAAALGVNEAFRKLGALIEENAVIAQAEDFRGAPAPRSPENQALQLYRQAIAGGSVGALRDFVTLMMTIDSPDLRAEDFPGTAAQKQALVQAPRWEQQAAIYRGAIEKGYEVFKKDLQRFVVYQCIETMTDAYAPPWLQEILAINPPSLIEVLAARLAVNSRTMNSDTRAQIYEKLALKISTAVEKAHPDDFSYNDFQRSCLLKANRYVPELLESAHSLRDEKGSKQDVKLSKDPDVKIGFLAGKLGKFSLHTAATATSKVPGHSAQKKEGITPSSATL